MKWRELKDRDERSSAIDSNQSGTVSFLELLLAMDERSERPELPKFPALTGVVPATLMVHKAALLRVCRALDPLDTGRLSVKNFVELVAALFQALGRPLAAAERRAIDEELKGEDLAYPELLRSFEAHIDGDLGSRRMNAESLYQGLGSVVDSSSAGWPLALSWVAEHLRCPGRPMAAAPGATYGAAYVAAAPSNVSYGQYGSAPAGAGSFDARPVVQQPGIYGHPQPTPGAYAHMPPGAVPGGPPGPNQGSGREVLYGPPPSLTSGLPDPSSVERQKENYLHALEEQEQRSSQSLELQRKQQLELINTQAEQQKKRLFMQIDQQVKTQEMALTQQYNQQLLQLNQQYHQQKAALEQQAMQLTMEYQQQKMHEEMVKKQMELHREHYEVQARFQQDMQKMQGPPRQGPGPTQDPMGPTGGGYLPPMVQTGGGGSFVPPPVPNGAYMPPQLQSSGSYVPPPMPVMPDMAPGAGATYVPSYTGSGSYVPPPGGCNGIVQPQMPTYGPSAAAMGNYAAAPPTNYGQLPTAFAGCERTMGAQCHKVLWLTLDQREA
eukprot:s407_g4.t1